MSAIGYEEGLVAYRLVLENTTATDFNSFILNELLPNVPVGGVIIMDNASIHKCPELQVPPFLSIYFLFSIKVIVGG